MKKKVFVAVSGGVDSAVAAHMLKNEGHEVTGVFIRVWQPAFLACNQDEEEQAAKRVAASLGIPFRHLDLAQEYKRSVVDEMVEEYKAGRTPNPDVLCNSTIKFGSFLDYALAEGADKIATGHHARIREEGGISKLLRGIDRGKDQVYFLWKLTQKELRHTLMPIGEMTKQEVRSYARQHGIPSAHKPDSQGLCFMGDVNMRSFLENFIETKPGHVLDEQGKVIGSHDGAELVTLGQRGGFTITDKDAQGLVHYVVAKDIPKNTITISTEQLETKEATDMLELRQLNQLIPLKESADYSCEIRYHAKPIACTLKSFDSKNARILLDEKVVMAPGQSLVLYDDDVCVGGGIVV
ncbi:tRNA 2-thiouridine(34) synthase MnmA [bacterium]|nr:tRNA 2-thiouridine(34) synthase MnmA [bacterium]|tara:strand:- start:22595 stop:23650 length:1056 start_codon:yes stop_codon:yes gene_type:complete